MNLANKLTLLRVVLVPVFMALLLGESMGFQIAALAVFIIASLTDMLDGKIARRYNQMTTFGKFADPLADKMLTTSAFLVFMQQGIIDVSAVMIILIREFAVSGVRLAAAGEGKVIAASFFGKFKTVAQMAAIIITILINIIVMTGPFITRSVANHVSAALIWISVVFTVLSGADYIIKNWGLMKLK